MKRGLVERDAKLSVNVQLVLLGLSKGSFYYMPKGECEEKLAIIGLMDRHIFEGRTARTLNMQAMLEEHGINKGRK